MSETSSEQNANTEMDYGALYRQGTELLHKGKANASLPFLEQAHDKRPEDLDAGINLAGAYILTKKFRKAVEVLEPLSELYPDEAMLWTNLGAAYLGNPVLADDGAQQRAIAAFEQALERNPIAPSVAYNIGLIYRDRKEYDRAIEWFTRAVQHNPQDLDARSLLAKMSAENDQE